MQTIDNFLESKIIPRNYKLKACNVLYYQDQLTQVSKQQQINRFWDWCVQICELNTRVNSGVNLGCLVRLV
jgi:hypothetical protein